jgi:PucR family transcriptional regulator, purine catabolism regulatory protein
MRVRQILQLACVQSGLPSCVAGKDGLDRPVRWVHSGEVTEIAEVLQGGELLLTTGVGFGATAAEQRRYVQALNRRGVAGVMLELGTRHPCAPPALQKACEDAGMPLITLGRQVRFVSITEAAHREIVTDQLDVLERADEEGRRFTDMVLAGAETEDLLAALAGTIRNPVVLVRADGELVALAPSRVAAGDALAAWRSGHDQWSTPVPAATGQWGELAVVALEAAIDAFGRACAMRAASVLALALMRAHEDDLLALREHGALLEAAAFDRTAIGDLVLRADALGFAQEGRALLPFAVQAVPGASRQAWSQLGRDLRCDLDDRHLTVLMGSARSRRLLLGVAAVAPERGRERATPQLAEATAAAATRRLGSRASVRLALGGASEQWTDAATGLRDAADVAAEALQSEWSPWVDASNPGLTVLLRRLSGSPELEAFWRRQLEALERHEARGGLALLATLHALCDHGWSKAAAARTLGLERPSLYHHIARIERLIGASLDAPLVQTQLHVALLARDLAITDGCRVNRSTNGA